MKKYIVLFVITLGIFFGYLINNGIIFGQDNTRIATDDFKHKAVNYGGEIFSGDKVIMSHGNTLFFSDIENKASHIMCCNPECVHNTDDCCANYPSGYSITSLYYKEQKMYAIGVSNNYIVVFESDLDGKGKKIVCKKQAKGTIEVCKCFFNDELNNIYIVATSYDSEGTTVGANGIVDESKYRAEFFTYSFNNKIEEIYEYKERGYQFFPEYISYDNKNIFGVLVYQERKSEDLYYDGMTEFKSEDLYKYFHRVRFKIDASTNDVHIEGDDFPDYKYLGSAKGEDYFLPLDNRLKVKGAGIIVSSDSSKRVLKADMLTGTAEGDWYIYLSDEEIFLNHHAWESADKSDDIYVYSYDGKLMKHISKAKYFVSGEIGDYYTLTSVHSVLAMSDGSRLFVRKKDIDDLNKKVIAIDTDE